MIKNIWRQLRMLKKNKKFVTISVAVMIAIIIGGFLLINRNGVDGQTAVVIRGDITQVVSVTGSLKPVDEVELSFNRSGKVAEVLVGVGDNVDIGQVVVRLDNRDAAIALEEAKVDYEDLVNINPLDITKAQNDVKEYEADLASSYDDARSTLSLEIKELNDVVNGLDDLFSQDGYLASNSYGMSGVAKDRRDLAEDRYYDAQKAVKDFLKIYQADFSSNDPSVVEAALTELYTVATICAEAAKQAKDITTYLKERDYGDPAGAEAAYETVSDLAVAANDSVDNVFMARDSIDNTKRLLSEADLDLADLVDGPDFTDIRASKLAIEQKEKDFSDYFLISPIAGVITRQDAKVGEQVSSGVSVVSVISADKLEIEANVPEVDIGRVAVGHDVSIIFDAFPEESFSGRVIMIDPAQTVIDGVVNFKVTIALDMLNDKLRSGLTANVEIKSVLAQDILLVPRAAVVDRDSAYFVSVVEGNRVVERQVKTGVFGQIGNVEVLQGLNEGEVVLIGQ